MQSCLSYVPYMLFNVEKRDMNFGSCRSNLLEMQIGKSSSKFNEVYAARN